MSNEDFFKNTPLGQSVDKSEAAQEKPKVEEIEYDYKTVRINRQRTDGIVDVRIRDASGVTDFEVRLEDMAYRGQVDHEGRYDIDKKDDKQLYDRQTETLKKLISDKKI